MSSSFRLILAGLALCAAMPLCAAPSQVRIVAHDGAHHLTIDGQPFRVLGAGLADGDQEALAARGGNAFRTWSSSGDPAGVEAMLDRAQRNGLMVAMGLDVARERHGFDYDDAAAVERQLQRVRDEVLRYKDHPAVLMWLVGNELNLEARNPKVWDAVEQIARMIHAVDPAHPVMTPLAGFDPAVVSEVVRRAPSLDLLGLQLYGEVDELQHLLQASAWRGPYIVTEWGPTGHWESPATAWGAPIEDDASTKANLLQRRYREQIDADRRRGLGSFVFLWGHKQERTPTWYGLFLPSGETTPGIDAMQYAWTGRWPGNRAPSTSPITLDGRAATDSVVLQAGRGYRAAVQAGDADGDPLRYRWSVREESTATSIGGDPEALPRLVEAGLRETGDGRVQLTAPTAPGDYRLFVEIHDGRGHAAYANFPFQVRAD
ncbi:glycoside hydrolase family 2 TIM barrel-domain containing protein [Xanthomonas sp. XNM01]|uniref:glycoside hydrolase family 2 TIM barrel-domain containing protein n=1 Tax=Xanthomonas sp. XNM01 TaxID=2769289 RepID=UPI00177D89D8|nr:glycoside hydrolase family 2 TIM barrel-domain containing protein [Xanthomonas sp. XNM01]MBD9369757.1 hypothetical protein [Xanthomonas sp. XNM01]